MKDTCHVVGCEEAAADIAWVAPLNICIQVCANHAFETLSPDAAIDLDKATEDHAKNTVLYETARRQ